MVPTWSEDKGRCHLLTLKMRQNSLEELTGIEVLVSIEELDLSDNFITHIPEQIRHLSNLKRVRNILKKSIKTLYIFFRSILHVIHLLMILIIVKNLS